MATAQSSNVHLETVEGAENQGAKPEEVRHPSVAGLPVGNTRLRYWRVAESGILSRSITNEKLALAGYYDFPAQYEQLHKLHLCD